MQEEKCVEDPPVLTIFCLRCRKQIAKISQGYWNFVIKCPFCAESIGIRCDNYTPFYTHSLEVEAIRYMLEYVRQFNIKEVEGRCM